MKIQANIGNSQTLKRNVFIKRLRYDFKKSSMAELQITLQLVTQELAKRQKGKKSK